MADRHHFSLTVFLKASLLVALFSMIGLSATIISSKAATAIPEKSILTVMTDSNSSSAFKTTSSSSSSSSSSAASKSSASTQSVNKDNLKNALKQADNVAAHLSDYAKISQNLLQTAISNGQILVKRSDSSQADVDQQTDVIKATIAGMVKENYNPNRYAAVFNHPDNTQWLDTDGAPIQAHGGGFVQVTGSDGTPTYYWVGEDKSHNHAFFNGINLYASKDLKNWTYVNTILKPNANDPAMFDVIMERPKILYNQKNKQFVVWVHWERQGSYSSSQVAVATSQQADGPYKFLGHWRPGAGSDSKYRNWGVKLLNSNSNTDTQPTGVYDNGTKMADYKTETADTAHWGTPSRDFTLFEEGNKAYIISTESGTMMRIYELNSDFTDVDKQAMKSYELFNNARREAPALVKAGKYYILATSQQSGWSPNQGRYSYTTDLSNPNGWKVNQTTSSNGNEVDTPIGLLGDNSTYHSQPTNIMKVTQNGQTNYIYMGDSWLPSEIGQSGYIWLPLTITGLSGNEPSVAMAYTPKWSLDSQTGKVDVPNNPLLSKNMPVTASTAKQGHEATKAVDGDASTTYYQPEKVPYTYTIDLKASQPLSRVDLSFRLTNGSETYNQYTIETSNNNKTWTKQVDESNNQTLVGFLSHQLTGSARYIKLTVNKVIKENGNQEADWAAGLVEMSVYGPEASVPDTGTSSTSGLATSSSLSSAVSSSNVAPSSSTSTASSSSATSSSVTAKPSHVVKAPRSAAKKGSVVMALKKINLYKTATFKIINKIATYKKMSRAKRPVFSVTGYARSTNGRLRYRVRDINRDSKNYGKQGYITAKADYVSSLYYKSMPKSKTVAVISKHGINAYKNEHLAHPVTHYKFGTRLKIKKWINYRLVTRYQLSNGYYITANKKLVVQKR